MLNAALPDQTSGGMKLAAKILIAPSRYVQGSGAIRELGEQTKHLGRKAFVTGGRTALSLVRQAVAESLSNRAAGSTFELFGGETSGAEIDRLRALAHDAACDFVIGVGGGKAIDTAKAVAYYLEVPVVIVPTVASSDAPCSALSVIYTEEGVFERYLVLPRNPDLVLVDTEIIARAPVRLLVAGIGDALATRFEAEACAASAARNLPGGSTTVAALALARLCYDTLLAHGRHAVLAARRGVVSPALERVVEANTLLSGLGFESSGLAAAHAVHDGLTALPETHAFYHGEKVAFGTLTQLVMEERDPDELEEVLSFCLSVGLPVTLEGIGVRDPDRRRLYRVAAAAAAEGSIIHNMPFPVDADMVYNALVAADTLGVAFLGEQVAVPAARLPLEEPWAMQPGLNAGVDGPHTH